MQDPYYQDDHCTIYHGDCLDLLPQLSGASAIVTDPPYGVGLKYDDGYDDRRKDYWEWFQTVLTAMRSCSPTLGFTHRVAALRHISDWDWVGVWNKPLAMAGLVQFPVMPHWEPVFLYGIQGRRDLPRRYDVLTVPTQNASAFDHPAPKPVSLFIRLIEWLAPSGTVLDPFMGSGTTLRAAKDIGRPAIGIEISERYCEVAAKRLAQEVLFS